MSGFGKRGWRMAVMAGAGFALVVLACLLAGVIGANDMLAQRVCYTSICTRCGRQTAEDFYLVLGTEILKRQKVLAASESTKVPGQGRCAHDSALIGKSGWMITKQFGTARLEAGEPRGWNYRGGELEKDLRALAGMRPVESIRYVHALNIAPKR